MDIQKMVARRIEEMKSKDSFKNGCSGYNEDIDRALTEIAGMMLEITDRLTRDYARLEKDLLDSRLEVLKSIESVLDTALSVKRSGRKASLAGSEAQGFDAGGESVPPGFNNVLADNVIKGLYPDKGRASMVSSGVSALFQRTERTG